MSYLDDKFEIFNKKIKNILPEVNKEIVSTIKFLKNSDYIKKSKSNSLEDEEYIKKINNKIELNLDYLLNPYTENEFNILIDYWKTLNPKSAYDYKKMFNELYE